MILFQSAKITAADQFTKNFKVSPSRKFTVSVIGTGAFVATITLERLTEGVQFPVQTFTSDSVFIGEDGEWAQYRVGVKPGDYTSGTISVRIGQGPIDEQ